MVEGAPHTAKRSEGLIVVSMGCPLPQYIKEKRRGGAGPLYGVPCPCSRSRSQGKGRKKERKEGARPLPLVQFGLGLGGGGRGLS